MFCFLDFVQTELFLFCKEIFRKLEEVVMPGFPKQGQIPLGFSKLGGNNAIICEGVKGGRQFQSWLSLSLYEHALAQNFLP